MTTTGGLISWGAICVTYLRFRKAYLVQGVKVVPEAMSPLQPALAWYGLIWIIVLSIIDGIFLANYSHIPRIFNVCQV